MIGFKRTVNMYELVENYTMYNNTTQCLLISQCSIFVPGSQGRKLGDGRRSGPTSRDCLFRLPPLLVG